MASRLVKLEDGLLVEIAVPEDHVDQISGRMAEKVRASMANIEHVLSALGKPLKSTWEALNQDVAIESAEVELGLNFEAEGNLYITKGSVGANLTIKLTMAPKSTEELTATRDTSKEKPKGN